MSTFDARRLGRLQGSRLAVVGYRNQAPGYDPRSGEGARRLGGRFNPPHSFPVLYLCLSRPCIVAELSWQAERQSLEIADLLPRELWRMTVELTKVLDLTDESTLASLGIETAELVRAEHGFTQQIGDAAHENGFQAIRAPSATGVDDVLALFPENLAGVLLHVELVGEWTTPSDLL